MAHTDAGGALVELCNQLADFGAAFESAGEHDKAAAYVHAVKLAQDAINRLDGPEHGPAATATGIAVEVQDEPV